ncbi:MAG: FTR1 family protein [Patescibacteria group bacterium]|nr:FTR1 family protein [Patescibacteria group bacterium]
MLATALIAFREFFEAFLIIGVFLGVSKKLKLKKGLEIWLAAATGFFLSFSVILFIYIFGAAARPFLTEHTADLLESYLLVFSGLFIAYVILSLHGAMNKSRSRMVSAAQGKLEEEAFDVAFFFTIAFLVLREGFEVALFSASISLFNAFLQNAAGLIFGFLAAAFLGVMTFFAYVRFPVGKVFKTTEYLVLIVGASLTQMGITKLLQTHFGVLLSNMAPLRLQFLPDEESWGGTLLQGFLGIDREYSGIRFLLSLLYIGCIYFFFLRPREIVRRGK